MLDIDQSERENRYADMPIGAPGPDEEWVVLHTRPRAEKKLCAHFERDGMPMYLPLRRKEHRYGGRRRAFWSPLFPGYVFGVFPAKMVPSLRNNQYVANVLRVLHQGEFVHQLRQLQLALRAGDMVEVMPYLEKGKPVRIIAGPLKGVEGIVENVGRRTKVVISIEMIQKSVFTEVDSANIEMV